MYLLAVVERGLEYLGPHEDACGVPLGAPAPAEALQRLLGRAQPVTAAAAAILDKQPRCYPLLHYGLKFFTGSKSTAEHKPS